MDIIRYENVVRGDVMKRCLKRIIFSIVSSLLLLLVVFLFYPLSFGNKIKENSKLFVVCIKTEYLYGKPSTESKSYEFAPDTKEYKEIQSVLDQYLYHHCLRSIVKSNGLTGNGAEYVIQIYSGEDMIIFSSENNDILINDRIYKVGYLGNEKIASLTDDIIKVLQEQ